MMQTLKLGSFLASSKPSKTLKPLIRALTLTVFLLVCASLAACSHNPPAAVSICPPPLTLDPSLTSPPARPLPLTQTVTLPSETPTKSTESLQPSSKTMSGTTVSGEKSPPPPRPKLLRKDSKSG